MSTDDGIPPYLLIASGLWVYQPHKRHTNPLPRALISHEAMLLEIAADKRGASRAVGHCSRFQQDRLDAINFNCYGILWSLLQDTIACV